jgi:2-polyprenyl-3-methyl-5-hydroxy-6-metoxy-1,4-benzoquinol methylase
LTERYARLLPASARTAAWNRRPILADVAGGAPFVLVLADPEAFLAPGAALRLLGGLARGAADVAVPVTNEPWCEEARGAPPFSYHTPSQLEEGAAALARANPAPFRAAQPRSPAFAVRRSALAALPSSLELERVVEEIHRRGGRVDIDPGAYLHRYGDMDAQPREDLVAKVPAGATAVLDVGCSRGATAESLRRAGVSRIVGIEPNEADAVEARRRYDRVLALPLENVREEFRGEFDAVFFGDVLEHLTDPSAALERVRPWLSPQGVVVASLPHVGHWSVISDLLEGRFDYIPYSILSGTHVRFFTRRTIVDLFEASGYRIETIETVSFPASPAGLEKLARLSAFPQASEDLSVVEFLVVGSAAR